MKTADNYDIIITCKVWYAEARADEHTTGYKPRPAKAIDCEIKNITCWKEKENCQAECDRLNSLKIKK
jgi:hypothetical protein